MLLHAKDMFFRRLAQAEPLDTRLHTIENAAIVLSLNPVLFDYEANWIKVNNSPDETVTVSASSLEVAVS